MAKNGGKNAGINHRCQSWHWRRFGEKEAQNAGHAVIGTARNISGLTDKIEWLELDVTSAESAARFAKNLQGRQLDTLICNAGVYPDKGLSNPADFSAEIFTEAFAVNVTGVWLTIQAALPNLLSSKGKIAVLSSIMASSARAPGGSYAYRASKAAVTNLARNLATDMRAHGIAVGSYHPGWVRTEMGGQNADISVEVAVNGLWRRIEHLSLETTGVFEGYDGTVMAF